MTVCGNSQLSSECFWLRTCFHVYSVHHFTDLQPFSQNLNNSSCLLPFSLAMLRIAGRSFHAFQANIFFQFHCLGEHSECSFQKGLNTNRSELPSVYQCRCTLIDISGCWWSELTKVKKANMSTSETEKQGAGYRNQIVSVLELPFINHLLANIRYSFATCSPHRQPP